jgi:hypothetical protein
MERDQALPMWDDFVSDASEDGLGFVRPLVVELETPRFARLVRPGEDVARAKA